MKGRALPEPLDVRPKPEKREPDATTISDLNDPRLAAFFARTGTI